MVVRFRKKDEDYYFSEETFLRFDLIQKISLSVQTTGFTRGVNSLIDLIRCRERERERQRTV